MPRSARGRWPTGSSQPGTTAVGLTYDPEAIIRHPTLPRGGSELHDRLELVLVLLEWWRHQVRNHPRRSSAPGPPDLSGSRASPPNSSWSRWPGRRPNLRGRGGVQAGVLAGRARHLGTLANQRRRGGRSGHRVQRRHRDRAGGQSQPTCFLSALEIHVDVSRRPPPGSDCASAAPSVRVGAGCPPECCSYSGQ